MKNDTAAVAEGATGRASNGRDNLDHESAVLDRYSRGAQAREGELCCPVDYDPEFLKILPREILDRDYGCGDPSAYVRPGERVLDLGSGGGKICYIISQKTGPEGRVIGVDMNDDMLELAEKYRGELAGKIGWSNVEFRKGKIQDLKTDPRAIEAWLAEHPVNDAASLAALDGFREAQGRERPLIASDSIDVIVSNCVLNLVRPLDKAGLFAEMFRVLARGGRAVISDIVSDEDVTGEMRDDPDLWSGCISGAYREDLFLKAFEDAGFHGVEVLKWDADPWQTVHGIEFRSVTVQAWKGKHGPCIEKNQAVVYKGPFRWAQDDDGHRYTRGERIAVCEKTFNLLKSGPYAEQMIFIEPREPTAEAAEFDCSRTVRRHPRESKGLDYDVTTDANGACCGPDGC